MATQFRAETNLDPATGLYYVEVYYPDNAATPIATTQPTYSSISEAEQDILSVFRRWVASTRPPRKSTKPKAK